MPFCPNVIAIVNQFLYLCGTSIPEMLSRVYIIRPIFCVVNRKQVTPTTLQLLVCSYVNTVGYIALLEVKGYR